MKNQYRLLIFDWDGTLMDSIEWIVHCLQRAAEDCHFDPPAQQACRDIIGLSLQEAMQKLFPQLATRTYLKLTECYKAHFFSKTASRNDLFPGTYQMLKQLSSNGYTLAVATGKTRTGLDKVLAATGTTELFTATRCADEALSKPNPLMLRQLIEEIRIPECQALMIGDSIHDLEMAYNAQITSIGVTCGAHNAAELQQHRPLTCLKQTTELLDLL